MTLTPICLRLFQIKPGSYLFTQFPKFKTKEGNGKAWYNCRKCKGDPYILSKRWLEHNQRADHKVPDKEGNCEPDGYVICIDAFGYHESYIEVADFIKSQTGIKNAKRKADILKR